MQDKLAWYYNEYVARTKAADKRALYRKAIRKKLRRHFPGFAKLYRFRNDLAHGVVNSSAESLAEAQRLRRQAKDIVKSIFAIATSHGRVIPPSLDYYEAIRMPPPITLSKILLQATTTAQP